MPRHAHARYANQQIAMANQMLDRHRPGSGGFCSCSRELLCSIAAHATTTREHYRSKLALLDATTVPVIPTAPTPPPPSGLRALLSRLTR